MALVVMALVVGVLLQLFGTSMRSAALARDYSFAVQVAESRLAEVGSAIKVEEGQADGTVDHYRWEVRMVKLKPESLAEKLDKLPVPLHLYQVEAKVTWQDGGKPRTLSLTSLRFGEE